MFTELRIQNFKAWKDTDRIRLAPLTVFFGGNSAGKTSIIQLLLMLKQTAESPDRKRVLHPGDQHTPVELGTFHDMVFGHDPNSRISFGLTWELRPPLSFSDVKTDQDYNGEAISFFARIGADKGRQDRLFVESMHYTLGDPKGVGLRVGMVSKGEGKEEYRLDFSNYKPVRNQGRGWGLPAPIRFYGFPNEAIGYYQNTGFVADLALALEQQLKQIHYLGPLRGYPSRSYVWSGEVPEHVGWRGERAVEALLAARDRRINVGYKKKTYDFVTTIARWLREMGLIESFSVRPIAEHRKEYEVRVKTVGSPHEVSLTDVGFGVSQVLPVVVESFYAPANSTLIFEQPEIHLHPKVQVAMADLFIEATLAREGGKDRNIQFIVESHSEHFLRRLQRRIAEERLKPTEVAIYYCERGNQGALLRELKPDEYGRIQDWPRDFFGDIGEEVESQTRQMLVRMARSSGAGDNG